MRFGKPQAGCIIHNEGIGGGDFKPVFYDCGCDKNRCRPVPELIHSADEISFGHSSMQNPDFGMPDFFRQGSQDALDFLSCRSDGFNPVVEKIYLSPALKFKF